MKIVFIFTLIFTTTLNLSTQTINKIAVFDNTEYSSSGIIGITENAIYEYSWYYDTWLSFPTNGLNEIEGNVIVNEVSACNNYSHNPSGIYVISDTSIHVYNYYAEYWYALYNTGLERIENIVQLSDLSVRYDIENEDEDIFVKSGDHIYYYEWYTQKWYPLTNEGITSKKHLCNKPIISSIYPNPVKSNSNIVINLPDYYNNYIDIAIFTEDNKFVKEIHIDNANGGENIIELNTSEFSQGIYFYEIKGVDFSHVKKFIKFD